MDRNTLLLSLVSTTLHTLRGVPVANLPTEPVRIDRLARNLADRGLEEEAFCLAYGFLDLERSRDRVFLSDLAEWLLLSPVAMRRLMAELESSDAIAA